LLLSILCFRFRRDFMPLRYAALYALGSASYTYASAWAIPDRMGLLEVVCSIGFCLMPATFWLLMGALFDDGFVPSPRKHAVLAMMAVLGAAEGLTHWRLSWLMDIYFAAAVGLFLAGLVQAVSGFVDDLVQGRRQFRILILFVAPLHALVLVAAELLSPGSTFAETGRILNSWTIAASCWAVAICFLRPNPILMAARPETAIMPADRQADPRDKAHLDKLDHLLTEERLYRDEGLSVASLAGRMGMSEKTLRRLINTRLGHRNFSAFVNGYRLAEAEAALADPAQADVPILTIALDAGFGSIGPFNRAFKASTGATPREFRNARLDRVSASSGQDSARSELPV
jgi:AraC-like DNA-binding protein